MKKIFLVFTVLSFFMFACGEDNSKKKLVSSANSEPAKKEISGEKLYKKNCVVCHGTQGDMGASGAANLQESILGLEERILVVTNGRNTMTPFKSILSEEKIKAVAEYTMKFKK